jgi:hypothetical protein
MFSRPKFLPLPAGGKDGGQFLFDHWYVLASDAGDRQGLSTRLSQLYSTWGYCPNYVYLFGPVHCGIEEDRGGVVTALFSRLFDGAPGAPPTWTK